MLKQFQDIGRDIFVRGLISSHGGNMSVRLGDRVLITRRGSMMGRLTERDLIETGLLENDANVMLASTELVVHRAIYQATAGLAVVHAHPPYTVTLSLVADEIVPVDSEGSYMLHKVPVVATEKTIGSTQVAEVVSGALKEYKIVVLRGHGSFAIGSTLEEAYQWTSSLEESAKIAYLAQTLGGPVKEYRRGAEEYKKW